MFPALAPGQSHSLQATFNSFIYLPIYYWRLLIRFNPMKFQKPGALEVVRQYLTKKEIIHNPEQRTLKWFSLG